MKSLAINGCDAICAAVKLEANLSPTKVGGCLEWTGYRNNKGYGRFKSGKRIYMAHRIAAVLAGKRVGAGQSVCHTCDNPPCCNPDHLFVGTEADNTADKVSKGRQWRPIGDRHPKARLTANDVRAIRASQLTRSELAKIYGVDSTTISNVIVRKTWKHVPNNPCQRTWRGQ